jgi:integrase
MCSSKAERRVPLPDSLVQALTLRHAANSDSLYLFPNKQGRPNVIFCECRESWQNERV